MTMSTVPKRSARPTAWISDRLYKRPGVVLAPGAALNFDHDHHDHSLIPVPLHTQSTLDNLLGTADDGPLRITTRILLAVLPGRVPR